MRLTYDSPHNQTAHYVEVSPLLDVRDTARFLVRQALKRERDPDSVGAGEPVTDDDVIEGLRWVTVDGEPLP